MAELLVILERGRETEARDRIRKDHRIQQQASRVLVVDLDEGHEEGVAQIPGVAAVTRGEVPPDVAATLSEGDALFVRGWITRMRQRSSKRRPGEGAAWDAPGRLPPDANDR